MGLAEYLTDSVSVSPGIAESRRFGLSVINVRGGLSMDHDIDLSRTFRDRDFDLAVVRYPSGNTEFSSQLSRLGYNMISTDPTVYWSLSSFSQQPQARSSAEFQLVRADTTDDVAKIVSSSFRGYRSHWHHNPRTSQVNMVDVYIEWLEAVANQPSFGAFLLKSPRAGEAIGMALLEFHDSFVEILLAGISEKHQGVGHYSSILEGVSRTALAMSCSRVVISTQASNINVQKAWARNGWLPEMTLQTVHLVKDES